MRKVFFFAAIAALAMTSCVEEKSTSEQIPVGEKGIAFALQGGTATRSNEPVTRVRHGETIELGHYNGVTLSLEETITELEYSAPATKGTPVYTENVGYLYANDMFVRAASSTIPGYTPVDAKYARMGNGPTEDGWMYGYDYQKEIWPDESSKLDFYMHIPYDMSAAGVTSLAYANGVTTVGYTSPTTAEGSKDLIFAGLNMSKEEYITLRKTQGGAKVTFYHALTGVKFAIKNTAEELADIQVTKISFKGLKNTGTFTFTTSTHAFNWTSVTATDDNVISQEFEDGDLVTYDKDTDGNHFADSFFNGGTAQNLNKDDASYTFWLVPQVIDDSEAILTIEYTIGDRDEVKNIVLGDLKNQNWQAGQLRTYTFKIDDVNVMIDDNVTVSGTAADGYTGSVKENVTITNTGNTKAFIRAALIGQWLDVNGDPIFGFTDKINRLYVVESWYEDQFVMEDHDHGYFVGLPGYLEKHSGGSNSRNTNPYNDWILCEDGFYYYTKVVDPEGTTAALFDTYTVGTAPIPEIAGDQQVNTNMHFVLEISTQAISAINGLDGTAYSDADWATAWQKASLTNTAPVKKQ